MGRRLVGKEKKVETKKRNMDVAIMRRSELPSCQNRAKMLKEPFIHIPSPDVYIPFTKVVESDDSKNPLEEIYVDKETICIEDWVDLADLESETHYIELEFPHGCPGWIKSKAVDAKGYPVDRKYLSTHTFYERTSIGATITLQSCGFNVVVVGY